MGLLQIGHSRRGRTNGTFKEVFFRRTLRVVSYNQGGALQIGYPLLKEMSYRKGI